MISGARAKYKGSGMINGLGDFGFMLTAIDEELTTSTDTDKFRIKIWDNVNDMVMYDNKMGAADEGDDATEISGGSIVIHK